MKLFAAIYNTLFPKNKDALQVSGVVSALIGVMDKSPEKFALYIEEGVFDTTPTLFIQARGQMYFPEMVSLQATRVRIRPSGVLLDLPDREEVPLNPVDCVALNFAISRLMKTGKVEVL